MDNIPLGTMKRLKAGPNVVASLAVEGGKTYAVDYDTITGPRELAAAAVNPFFALGCRRFPEFSRCCCSACLRTGVRTYPWTTPTSSSARSFPSTWGRRVGTSTRRFLEGPIDKPLIGLVRTKPTTTQPCATCFPVLRHQEACGPKC